MQIAIIKNNENNIFWGVTIYLGSPFFFMFMIFVPRQLPPVLDEFVFKKCRADGRPRLAPGHWNENFEISYLTQKMR